MNQPSGADMDALFLCNSMLLGAGLAMDAFSVSVADGLAYRGIERSRKVLIACVFAVFQFSMPLFGYFLVRLAAQFSQVFRKCIPWIALVLLMIIGGKMFLEGILGPDEDKAEHDGDKTEPDGDKIRPGETGGDPAASPGQLTVRLLLVQGIATSIDAFSVGFTIAGYRTPAALVAAAIIGFVTFLISYAGVIIGETFGNIVGSKASILGGLILMGIGIEIFVSHMFF